jgi:D-glycero-alpha-D-manno-heptose 1-phosphate guanylyltransferase
MAPVAGRPFLAWILDALADAGLARVVLSVGHLADKIQHAFGETYRTLELIYAVETSPLGTGGALLNGLALMGGSDEPIWVLNGDSIVRLAFAEMWAAHQPRRSNPRAITMASVKMPDAGRYGALEIKDGRVLRLGQKEGDGVINAGIYLLDRRVFDAWDLPAAFSLETDFLAPFADRLEIAAFATDGWFIDIGVPADYDRAQTELPAALAR